MKHDPAYILKIYAGSLHFKDTNNQPAKLVHRKQKLLRV